MEREHIKEMENWDEDYFNMEVQAYIEIDGLLAITSGWKQNSMQSPRVSKNGRVI
jgi:hypothetical protein